MHAAKRESAPGLGGPIPYSAIVALEEPVRASSSPSINGYQQVLSFPKVSQKAEAAFIPKKTDTDANGRVPTQDDLAILFLAKKTAPSPKQKMPQRRRPAMIFEAPGHLLEHLESTIHFQLSLVGSGCSTSISAIVLWRRVLVLGSCSDT